jgi:hypothetical protein
LRCGFEEPTQAQADDESVFEDVRAERPWNSDKRARYEESHSKREEVLEADGETRISDLHVWRVGRGRFCAASIVTHEPKQPAFYKSLLSMHEEIAHVTLEVNRCPG